MNDWMVGADIVKRALRYPMKLIANNAGVNGRSVVIEKVTSLITACPFQYDVPNELGI